MLHWLFLLRSILSGSFDPGGFLSGVKFYYQGYLLPVGDFCPRSESAWQGYFRFKGLLMGF